MQNTFLPPLEIANAAVRINREPLRSVMKFATPEEKAELCEAIARLNAGQNDLLARRKAA